MPYYKFRVALEQVAGQNNIAIVVINPAYTRQRCSRCGKIHKTNKVVFKCPSCGFECNRDRNASVNIAYVAGKFFKTITAQAQNNIGNASTNRHIWKYEDGLDSCSQQAQPSDFKP